MRLFEEQVDSTMKSAWVFQMKKDVQSLYFDVLFSISISLSRLRILQVLCSKLRLEGDFNFTALAKATPGYVGADLSALTGAAGIIAVKRIFKQLSDGTLILPDPEPSPHSENPDNIEQDALMIIDPPIPQTPSNNPISIPSALTTSFTTLSSLSAPGSIAHFLSAHPNPLTPSQLSPLFITSDDFTHALKQVQPSSKREGFATVPDVVWSDIGALHATREELHMAIVQPIRRPELFSAVGIEAACGVLLWGPPGCGKTLLAKAVANESRANFISVKGPELLNKVCICVFLILLPLITFLRSSSMWERVREQYDKSSLELELRRHASSSSTNSMPWYLDETTVW